MVTIFKDGIDVENPHYITVKQALSRIGSGKSKDLVEKIREAKLKGESYDGLKIKLPSVIWAGECKKGVDKVYKSGKKKGKKYTSMRDDESVTNHSGYFVIDFDHLKDAEIKKQQLKNDEYIAACWVSPSSIDGDGGVKAIVKCPPSIEKHGDYYSSFISRYPELDPTSRNLSRLCFESYDPDIFIRSSAKVWDKIVSKENTAKVTQSRTEKHNNRITSIAVGMIRSSVDGEKHDTLIKAAKLCGGYNARLDEARTKQILLDEVVSKGVKDVEGAKKAIDDGYEYGKTQPIHEIKKIEKAQQFIKKDDGDYDFIASKDEMDEYEEAYINGTLPMGIPTGLNGLDKHWMFKHNHLVWMAGIDNVGKSFIAWYKAVLQAMFNDKKFLLFSAENGDGQVRKKLKEFFLGRNINQVTKKERDLATSFVDKHFKIFSSKKMYTWEDFLMRAEIVFDEGWEYDCLIAEPYNSMDIPNEMSDHRHNVKSLNMLRVFKENYASIWVCDHAGSAAARDKDNDGYVKVPWKSSIDGGQMKANKVDDFLVYHRLVDHPTDWMVTEIHVQKIKDVESGGSPTQRGNPFRIVMNVNKCGYHQVDGFDPVKSFWDAVYRSGLPLDNNFSVSRVEIPEPETVEQALSRMKQNTDFDKKLIEEDEEHQAPF